ncbi:hypothetical protein CORC01_04245 [Colletotrichum orchidophilum]|uniref:Integral membrane protein n=1 Tax=Colletotrichum orchidophilum TaxID=1209926 RepID=A0A1G4BGL3_9PEZI|nr:uncharacterized protein CORC01_04245 [Colletotrichum orchidophilum]OHF00495.1 hypothetical protein CORC01_04245 [Colletotrichum orchidophilum]
MAAVYFETSWAILSTIGLANTLFGFIVAGITAFSPVSLIPIVVSIAGSIANGLCYYSFYADYPILNTAVASGVADVMWMIQESGISFYSYAILTRVLCSRDRIIFKSLFWVALGAIFILRMMILVSRVKILVNGESDLMPTINDLHVGYFSCLAVLECLSAFFLLRKFAAAKSISQGASTASALFQHLMRSTEIRLAILALIGVTRAVTYFFQPAVQQARTVAGQIDRFVYTLECMFPVMIFIDILASRLVYEQSTHENSSFRLANRNNSIQERLPSAGGNGTQIASVWSGGKRAKLQVRRESGTSRSSLFPPENVSDGSDSSNRDFGVIDFTMTSGITKPIEIKVENNTQTRPQDAQETGST